MNKAKLLTAIEQMDTYKRFGRIHRVVGLMIESKGPEASIGDVCLIHSPSNKKIKAEVVGFHNENILLMPFKEVRDIKPGSLVEATGAPLLIKTGTGLIGKVVDALGKPLDNQPLPNGLRSYPTDQDPPSPLSRPTIKEPLQVGVRAIDTLLTVGKGQRIGIFAGSGVGKSTLMGMIARNSSATINVIALIGERGREVREFIENDLGKEGLKKSIIVAVTSDQPALMRIKGAYTATAISEYFRDLGYQVNLMMDSVTRVAMAQREVGLATGEPPTTKGYTPSVFAMLPRLLERTGTSTQGTITAFYTVLVDGDDMNEPIADTVRGILDGHFILDRKLAEQNHFPAINVLKSISRVMNQVIDDSHKQAADRVRNLLATYEENRELIQIGAYKTGADRQVDEAIQANTTINDFLKQGTNEPAPFLETLDQFNQFNSGG
ncbi:flagellum-specific ATP synthase [Thalassobacillus devorans]|uniref:Flagellum-specific ATP synthase n=1 Tax=Thalassobacillus devorans TaxID=279813 RepID=A0ABQ1P719_9BACI|nr:flagellar protein export ATPase FliI [Thalassobacillus devorans]NIK27913.1 flagellum-specific ATP synthase [Thalassobacillus devorans]GGC90384.1 flagellum-specific ATP synthase [Thalassobacillus devorans]